MMKMKMYCDSAQIFSPKNKHNFLLSKKSVIIVTDVNQERTLLEKVLLSCLNFEINQLLNREKNGLTSHVSLRVVSSLNLISEKYNNKMI
jgi:hypothetical protein